MEIKELFDLIGYSGEEDIEQIKKHIGDNYIFRKDVLKDHDIVKSIVGKRTGDINTQIAKLFDYKHADLKERSIEEVLEEIKEKYESSFNELKERNKEGKDKQLLDLQKDLEEKQKSLQDYQKQNENLAALVEEKEKNYEKFKHDTTIDLKYQEASRKIPRKADITTVEELGFSTYFDNKYVLALDGENVIPKTKDGNMIPGEKPGKFATLEEVLRKELIEQKLAKVNNVPQEGAPPIIPGGNGTPEKTGRFREAY